MNKQTSVLLVLLLQLIFNQELFAINCNDVSLAKRFVSASTLCHITGKQPICKANDAICDQVFTKLLKVSWENSPIKEHIKFFQINEDGSLNISNGNEKLNTNISVSHFRALFEANPESSVDIARTTSNAILQFNSDKIVVSSKCKEQMDEVALKLDETNKNFASNMKGYQGKVIEVYNDQFNGKNKIFFNDKKNIIKGKCVGFRMRGNHPNQYLVKQVYEMEMDTKSFASRDIRIKEQGKECQRRATKYGELTNEPNGAEITDGISHVLYGIINFETGSNNWSYNYDFLHKSKKELGNDNVMLSGTNSTLNSDELTKSGLLTINSSGSKNSSIYNCDISRDEFEFVMKKKGLCLNPESELKCLTPLKGEVVGGCYFDPASVEKLRKEWIKTIKDITDKCSSESPIVSGKTAASISKNGLKDLSAINQGIPGMTIKNCSYIKSNDGRNFPGLYYVERYNNGLKHSHGTATLSQVDREKKRARLIYKWVYDNTKGNVKNSNGKHPGDYLTGESIFDVVIDENDNIIGLPKDACFNHTYLKKTSESVFKSHGETTEEGELESTNPIKSVQECFIDGKL